MIELLIVIAIIGVLVALTTAAVQQVLKKGPEVQTVSEVQQLEAACAAFKQQFGINPPDTILLPDVTPDCSAPASYATPPCQAMRVFQKMYPRWMRNATTGTATGLQYRDASGNLVAVTSPGKQLIGSQCLLFFLGGPNLAGFRPDGPYDAGTVASVQPYGPYYEFKTARIKNEQYLDPFDSPYVFFSTGAGKNYSFEPSVASNLQVFTSGQPGAKFGGANVTVRPVASPNPNTTSLIASPSGYRWEKPGGVQIISAGDDQTFGPGTASDGTNYTYWVPESGVYSEGETAYGADDISNFASRMGNK